MLRMLNITTITSVYPLKAIYRADVVEGKANVCIYGKQVDKHVLASLIFLACRLRNSGSFDE